MSNATTNEGKALNPETQRARIRKAFMQGAILTSYEANKVGHTVDARKCISVLRQEGVKIEDEKVEHYWTGPGRKKYDVLRNGERVNYFSFIVPEGLISPEEVPEWAGLIYVRPYDNRVCIGFDKETGDPIFDEHVSAWFTTVKDPVKLRASKVTEKELEDIEKKVYFRYHQLRCKLIKQKLVTPFGIT